jgi:hypothetical protein
MFGWFKRKPAYSEEKRKAASAIMGVVDGAFLLPFVGFNTQDERAKAVFGNKAACGYIFGLHDGLVQAFRTEPRDEDWEQAVFIASYERWFGKEGGAQAILSGSMGMQADPGFNAARTIGGNDALAFLRDKTPPLGLMKFMGALSAPGRS